MLYIFYLILFVLCVTGLTEITKCAILHFLKIKDDKSTILISPLYNDSDNAEFYLRSCITKIKWMGRLRPNRIIFLNAEKDENTKDICSLIRKEYEYVEVMTPNDFLAEFSQAKEINISSKEL